MPKATVIRMYRSFTQLITNPIVLMQIIGNRQLITISNKRQLKTKNEGQDRLSVFVILNNFLVINAKECVIIDSWNTFKSAWLLEEHNEKTPNINF